MFDNFDKKVRFAQNLDAILSNKFNYKTGSFYDSASEDYKTRINLCYDTLDYDLKIDLVDFVDDYLTILKAEILTQERGLNIKNDASDYAKDYLFSFVKLKYKYLKKWVKKKQKQLKNENQKLSIGEGKSYKWHILIRPIVSGAISNIQSKANKEFTKTELSKKIIQELGLKIESKDIEPYIQYSFIDSKNVNAKNLFSENKVKAIYEYCKKRDIEITDEIFLSKIKY